MTDQGNENAAGTSRPNAMAKLAAYGQSCWLDDLSRGMMARGELSRYVQSGIRGVTANPATAARALTSGAEYTDEIRKLAQQGRSAPEVYEALVTADIRMACDILTPVYEETAGQDGFVSLEVSARLANNTNGSIAEAKRLWAAVDRPNLFIKIPGTEAGVPAIEELLFEGININITLLFSVERYEAVADAYLSAQERRIAARRPIEAIASVASFFLSRIDVLVDRLLESRTEAIARTLQGKVATANARLAYQSMKQLSAAPRWQDLRSKGARVQRLLWASTSTKNPDYNDLMYVEPLVGSMTVNTLPEQTIAALLDHGNIAAGTIEKGVEGAHKIMNELALLGIDFYDVCAQLERDGVKKFADAYNQSIAQIEKLWPAMNLAAQK